MVQGSVGAALGPLLAGYTSTTGWNNVFLMQILAIFWATLFLIRIARTEIKGNLNEGKWSLYSIGHTMIEIFSRHIYIFLLSFLSYQKIDFIQRGGIGGLICLCLYLIVL